MNEKVEVLFAEAIDELQRMEQICFGTEAWTAETMEAWFSLPTVRFFGVRERGLLFGYVCADYPESDCVKINSLAVLPQYRRKGVATRLMRFALRQGARAGKTYAVLEAEATNRAALALYEAMGFRAAAIDPHYYGTGRHALVMVLHDLTNFR